MDPLFISELKRQRRARRHSHHIKAIERTRFAAFTNLYIHYAFACGLTVNHEHASLRVRSFKQRAYLDSAAFALIRLCNELLLAN